MVRIRAFSLDDVPFGLRLSEQAGWNQLPADWSRLHHLEPDGLYLAEAEGQPAGTTVTCRFGPVAWVAMVLVDPSMRRRGIGRALMLQALEDLEQQGVRTIRLDATPLGRPLYESLGFLEEYSLTRYAGRPSATGSGDEDSSPEAERLDDLIALDRRVTGTDRGKLLRRLQAEHPEQARIVVREGQVTGYVMARPGRLARQIGPCIGDDNASRDLLRHSLTRFAGQEVFLDVPDRHPAARSLALTAGLLAQRPLMRMRRGAPVNEVESDLWASSGPEMG